MVGIWDLTQTSIFAQSIPDKTIRVPILEYHEANHVPGNSITLRPNQFAEEANWLAHHGYHTINFSQLYAALYNGHKLPNKPVLLTFDDGYESVYKKVFPVIQKNHQQITVFMISGYIGVKSKFPMLTTEELKTMERSNLVDVESHTVSHPDLSRLSRKAAEREIVESKRTLEHITGHPIRYFCYPSGRHNATTIELLKAHGYLLAVVQGHQKASLLQGPYTLKRIVIYETTTLEQFIQCVKP